MTLYIALAIEMRLLRRKPEEARLPDDMQRGAAVFALATLLVPLLLSAMGVLAALQALYSGGTPFLALTTYVGTLAILGLFLVGSLDYLFRFIGILLIPASWRRPVAVGFGGALIVGGIVTIFL